MAQDVRSILQNAELYIDPDTYAYIKLPVSAITVAASIVAEIGEPFTALIVDKDEVTLLIPDEAVTDFESRLRGHTINPVKLRLITFDVELDMSVIGFMAAVSAVLAEADVTIFPFAAYSRDHVLVPADKLEAAVEALQKSQSHE